MQRDIGATQVLSMLKSTPIILPPLTRDYF
jgi:hypothetical protein